MMSTEIENIEFCYSHDGETFNSDMDSVIDEVWHNNEDAKVGDKITIYRGIIQHRHHKDYLDVMGISESMLDQAYDDLSDFADGYLDELTAAKSAEFERAILDWLNVNIPQPQFHGVKDIQEIEITLED